MTSRSGRGAAALGLGIALALMCSRAPAGAELTGTEEPLRPNVVLISLDTLRPDHLGCYGYGRGTSPELDRFASQGILFLDARSQAPWTLPSHMSLFTSMLPSHNRVEDINERLSEDIPTLAQILRARGYNTAALVNNGQMRAHWGFDRGFGLWREYEVDTPAGNCENITAQALQWLRSRPKEPFFLFLHYYDPHDPYEPPPPYLERFGSTVSGLDARQILWTHRYPGRDIRDQQLLREIIGAYDGEIAWLDHELGKLLAALPENTLTVIFSDHGEAFEEHGWTTHGASLYEEEVRVLLLIRPPGGCRRPLRCDEPVMLLDVAPTILSMCGIKPPEHFEGQDLSVLLHGGALPRRPILSETKRLLEGRVLKMCILPPYKLIYSLLDGAVELYRLPDEHTDLSATEPLNAVKALEVVREWAGEEDFWILYASGEGTYEATLKAEGGRFTVFIPVGCDLRVDRLQPARDGSELRVTFRPRGGTKGLYFELTPRRTTVSFDLLVNGQRRTEMVFVGTQLTPRSLPLRLGYEAPTRDPFISAPFRPGRPGFHILRFRRREQAGRSPAGVTGSTSSGSAAGSRPGARPPA